MKLRATDRVFADHYQFYLHDSGYDHFSDPKLEWKEENRQEHGYLATDKAIYVSTVAHLNDHRVRIYLGGLPEEHSYERTFVREVHVESGRLVLSALANNPDENVVIDLEPGVYCVSVCGNAIGKDQYSFEPDGDFIEDEDYLANDAFEHYDIYISRSEQAAGDQLPARCKTNAS